MPILLLWATAAIDAATVLAAVSVVVVIMMLLFHFHVYVFVLTIPAIDAATVLAAVPDVVVIIMLLLLHFFIVVANAASAQKKGRVFILQILFCHVFNAQPSLFTV